MNVLEDLFSRHDKVALLFSGGKDSLACFYLCEPWWDRLTLVWVDTGRNLQEVEVIVTDCAKRVGRVARLTSDQHTFVTHHGHPTDVVISDSTGLGQLVTRKGIERGPRVCDKWECCKANIWDPIARWMATTDCTAVIKGQKACDHYFGPSWGLPATKADGSPLEMCLPVLDWTDDDCRKFLKDRGNPELLALEHTSFDCWDCTAYWEGLPGRIQYLKQHHPEKARHVIWLFREMRKDISRAVSVLDENMEKEA